MQLDEGSGNESENLTVMLENQNIKKQGLYPYEFSPSKHFD